MVGSDGWCRHYDKSKRICKIYETRPDFCRVDSINSIFDVPNDKLNDFAINCCKQQIRFIYGGKSKELKSFNRQIKVRHKLGN